MRTRHHIFTYITIQKFHRIYTTPASAHNNLGFRNGQKYTYYIIVTKF